MQSTTVSKFTTVETVQKDCIEEDRAIRRLMDELARRLYELDTKLLGLGWRVWFIRPSTSKVF